MNEHPFFDVTAEDLRYIRWILLHAARTPQNQRIINQIGDALAQEERKLDQLRQEATQGATTRRAGSAPPRR